MATLSSAEGLCDALTASLTRFFLNKARAGVDKYVLQPMFIGF
jgi:hypothetical protein